MNREPIWECCMPHIGMLYAIIEVLKAIAAYAQWHVHGYRNEKPAPSSVRVSHYEYV